MYPVRSNTILYHSDITKTPTSNVSICQEQEGIPIKVNDNSEVELWVLNAICIVISITGIMGNGLVIHLSTREHLAGTFRRLNEVVRNLAVTDFLNCVLASPFQMAYWYIGESCLKFLDP